MAKSKGQLVDELAGELASNLNKKFKDSNFKVAYFLDGDTDAPSNVKGWVGSGSSMLDLAISNKPKGGFPVGRITEITGLEASGKSLLAAHALANTQEKDGLAVYIDTENPQTLEKQKNSLTTITSQNYSIARTSKNIGKTYLRRIKNRYNLENSVKNKKIDISTCMLRILLCLIDTGKK